MELVNNAPETGSEAFDSDDNRPPQLRVFHARLTIALVQAAMLYLLDKAVEAHTWPATNLELLTPLRVVFTIVPVLMMLGAGQVRTRPLAIWTVVATLIVAGLGLHSEARGTVKFGFDASHFQLWVALVTGTFVAHVLVVDSILERRLVPSYARHFDTAWKQGVQAILAAGFVGLFWGVLYLGATLFDLVGVDFFLRLIGHDWFYYPAIALALAVSIHVTDVQPSLIRGARSLALTLFSWLLPLLALILLGFLCSLPFLSLGPLWNTRRASNILLVAAGLLVFFINSSYQDGTTTFESRRKQILAAVGAVELVPLVGLAIWALALRVNQYGWTTERIMGAAAISLVACYAVGYVTAVLTGPTSLRRIEMTNFMSAYVFLFLILVLFSPVADPGRLMVADQIARLESGEIAPDKFDFASLKFDGARWGATALSKLSQSQDGPDAATIRQKASAAIALQFRPSPQLARQAALTQTQVADRIAVYPSGKPFPSGLVDLQARTLANGPLPACLIQATGSKCTARYITLQAEDDAILFVDSYTAFIVQQDALGQWRRAGQVTGPVFCSEIRQGLMNGPIELEAHPLPDIVIGLQRLSISPPSLPCLPAGPR